MLFLLYHRGDQRRRVKIRHDLSSRTILTASAALNFLPPVETTKRPRLFFRTRAGFRRD